MTDPVTVITGAAGALGSAVADVLLEHGHKVAAVDREGADWRDTMDSERRRNLTLDVTDSAAWAAALETIRSALGPPTGGVLIAGGFAGGAPVADEKDATTWQRMFAANADTAQASIRALLPPMVARKAGSIVVIGSRAVERPWENAGAAAYAASKSALVAYARTIAQETLAHGVRVNAVLPSTIDTPANRSAMPNADPAKWVTTRSIAGVIAFLLSDAARDVSGAAIPVYGRG
jgi:NAD(P)-dependent dehydrogenase (short-subunit alcohol dehydrogenase family)